MKTSRFVTAVFGSLALAPSPLSVGVNAQDFSGSELGTTSLPSFEEYLLEFQKSWSASEYERRRAIYQQNVARIQEHNHKATPSKNGASYKLGLDPFADLEPHEMMMGYDKAQVDRGVKVQHGNKDEEHTVSNIQSQRRQLESLLGIDLYEPVETLPPHVDWRKAHITTPVKSQGMCGSCWAFAATSVLESHLALQTGVLMELSVQQLVSCAPNPKNCGGQGGCEGSTGTLAFDNVFQHGMLSEWEFGYNSYHPNDDTNKCPLEIMAHALAGSDNIAKNDRQEQSTERSLRHKEQPRGSSTMRTELHNTTNYYKGAVMGIGGWVSLPSNDYVAVMNAVAKLGPMVVAVACHPWFAYHDGVFPGSNFSSPDAKTSDTDVNHMVVLEGYGTDEATGEPYWLIRNSWGPKWGEGGYIRLKRDDHASCGIDVTPADGISCTKDDHGQDMTPPNAVICGNSGILYDVSVPIGGFLL